MKTIFLFCLSLLICKDNIYTPVCKFGHVTYTNRVTSLPQKKGPI